MDNYTDVDENGQYEYRDEIIPIKECNSLEDDMWVDNNIKKYCP